MYPAACGRVFVFAPLKRSAGRTFPPCTQHTRLVLLRRTPRRMRTPWKQYFPDGPGGDAKSLWTARSIPQSPLSSRISPCASPASLLLHRKILFAQNLGIVPTTDSFTHPLPMLHKPACNSFPPHAPPKSLRWFGTHGLRPCKTATKCRTPYADQFVQRPSLLLRRTTAQTAQLLAVTPLASNKQGY